MTNINKNKSLNKTEIKTESKAPVFETFSDIEGEITAMRIELALNNPRSGNEFVRTRINNSEMPFSSPKDNGKLSKQSGNK